jgi:hypothetical protein
VEPTGAEETVSFEEWLTEVRALVGVLLWLSTDDAPVHPWQTMFDAGMTPTDAAVAALRGRVPSP